MNIKYFKTPLCRFYWLYRLVVLSPRTPPNGGLFMTVNVVVLVMSFYPNVVSCEILCHFLKSGMTSRGWCFTIFVETEDGRQARDPLFNELSDNIKFIAWQKERGGNTHRLHYQGFIQFKSPVRMTQVKTVLGADWAHIEKQRGTDAQAANYGMKEETRIDGPWTLGTQPSQGKRTDLATLCTMVEEGDSDNVIAKREPEAFARYGTHIKRLRNALITSSRRPNLKVYILIGLTGTGKSYWAWDHFPNLFCPIITESGKIWWDGYNQEKEILIDDFRGIINYQLLLRILDVYPLTGEVKCGTVPLNYTTVVITSNFHFNEWYPNLSHTDLDPLRRRCTGGIFEIRSREDLNAIQIE